LAQDRRPALIAALAAAILLAFAPAAANAQIALKSPKWSELSPQERQVLAPLGSDWENMDLMRRNKWREIAKRYPTLRDGEQQRLRERMEGWARLSSQERQAARERFKGINQLPPDQRRELSNKWHEYQNLPQEQRQQLQRAPRDPPSAPPARSVPPPQGR